MLPDLVLLDGSLLGRVQSASGPEMEDANEDGYRHGQMGVPHPLPCRDPFSLGADLANAWSDLVMSERLRESM
jgi:hypothetical protein